MDILIELKSAFMEKKEEDSVRSREQTEDLEKIEEDFTQSNEEDKSVNLKWEDGKLRTLSGHLVRSQGKNVRINIPLTTPSQTLSEISYLVMEDLFNQSSRKFNPEGGVINLNKTRLHHAEKMIKKGFIELYKGLGYLNDYRNLNLLAFIKILKKFDKVTEKQILPIYLKVVESSYFNNSDKVVKLMDEVEELFVKNFAQDDHRKAMKYLRPIHPRKESHAVPFFIGLFTGCFLALFGGYVLMAHLTGLYKRHQNSIYMETVFPVLSRYHFICVIRNIVWSPLYKVVMLDFFMADQLCSQVPMLRTLEFMACYYVTGSYKTQDYGYCMRCARRWFDEGETSHLINLGKYVSAMLAAGAKVAYEKDKSVGWLCVVVIMSSVATLYQLYWDFVKDWGLLQMNSKNPWLRNELVLRRKASYYFSMVLNITLRLAWLQTVLHSSFENVDYRVTSLFLAALEVIRRGLWNFFRLENEHLNNAGKFRAVKTVPLPFHEVVEDEED
ncbi:hypothetical protein TSUD_189740 [Trifolium subterraneum]|uniref:EXS domain-containing protein n=1 Tax=Trifolium subterraneum TaxID=3900 RepID=A0A2Z6NEP9_TRISU|nr:hypothetical protein TSUD_189740 [Trifolium subterraneum]